MTVVVSDTSAITALVQIGRESLLGSLYGEVLVPPAVHEELRRTHSVLPEFVRVVAVIDSGSCRELRSELDLGEAEAIVLAKEVRVDYLLMDERRGRRVAVREGLRVIGLLGAILAAKRIGLIPLFRPVVSELEAKAGFRVAVQVKEFLCAQAGE